MDQQDQTKKFFKGHAANWQKKANEEIFSTINDRHRAVHKTLSTFGNGSRFLDVGCGTGQLAIEASFNGFSALGLDFAEEMINQAKVNATNQKSNAKFKTASIFDFVPTEKYNVISAMGFIEYISLKQLDDFLAFCNSNTTDNGAISIGSRNRLFNLSTFNEYTELEKKLGTINTLFEEASICVSSKSNEEFITSMRNYMGSKSLIQNESHPITGIEVATRYQFTPSDLMYRIEKHGFKVSNIYSVHYHAFNPAIGNENFLTIRKKISEMVSENFQADFRFLPNSSSFVIEAKKVI